MLMENIALRHQLMVYERGRTARRSLSGNDRLLWCFLARFFSNWRDTLDIVQPATVTRWRRVRWWRHLLGGRRRRPGRPRIDPELQALILRMARENPRWGSMRILGELRHLGFELSNSTVRRYRGSAGDPAQQHWSTFYRNHGPYLAEALQEATIDSLRLMGTWIVSRLRLRVSAPRRQTKTAMPFVRADLVMSAGSSLRLVRPRRAMEASLTMVFEQPGFQCDNDPCSIQSEVLWTDVRSMHRTQPMSSTVANPQLYIFIDYIMLHEFGHTLGLPDFYADTTGLKNVVAIMNDSGAARNVKDEDIEQLRAIYILHTRH